MLKTSQIVELKHLCEKVIREYAELSWFHRENPEIDESYFNSQIGKFNNIVVELDYLVSQNIKMYDSKKFFLLAKIQ